MTTADQAVDAWKPCDLRGVYPETVSPELFRDIGSAVATLLNPASRVLVGGDFRHSTPNLKHSLCEGLLRAGAHVLDAGQLPTPVAYFAAREAGADAMLMVTASHNPPAHNGLKLMLRSMPMTPELLLEIRALTESRAFLTGTGSAENFDPRPAYTDAITKRWAHLRERAPACVVLDAGNGAWSAMAPAIFRALGFTPDCISCVADGNFPDRSPDCNSAANLARLRSAVRAQGDAIGIAWDGDGDRVAFVDEDGSYLTSDQVALLFVRAALEGNRHDANGKIVVDLKCSEAVQRMSLSLGGNPLLERTGHAFMRSRMVAEDALLGLDACGHYFFRELNGGDDGLFAALYLVDLVRRSGRPLSELRQSLPSIFSTPEIRIPITEISYAQACDRLTFAFPAASITQIDGLRFAIDDGVVLVRESGTEPVISLRIEGFTSAGYERVSARCRQSLPEAARLCEGAVPEIPASQA